MNKVNKNIKIPLHYQIYIDLLKQIQNEVYEEGDKLPSETELMEIYDVSRITVRGAVDLLVQEGIVEKYRGKKGTIVRNTKYSYDIKRLTSFSDDVHAYGGRPNSILLTFEIIQPTKKIAQALQLKEGENVYYIERLRLRQDIIVSLHRSYIKQFKHLNLTKDDFQSNTSLYGLLRQNEIIPITASEVLEAKMPSKEIRTILKIGEKQPIFYMERTTFTHNKTPIEFVLIYNNANYYRYKINMDINQN